MQAGEGSSEGVAWFVEADLAALARAGRRSWRHGADADEKSARVVIISSLFFVLIAGAFLVGGQAAIDPLLQSAIQAREAKGIGQVFYRMPDGIFCRHMSYDNATGAVSEGSLEHCTDDIASERAHAVTAFTWEQLSGRP
jgi:hypothetical protein